MAHALGQLGVLPLQVNIGKIFRTIMDVQPIAIQCDAIHDSIVGAWLAKFQRGIYIKMHDECGGQSVNGFIRLAIINYGK